jgi:alkaline phosphatase
VDAADRRVAPAYGDPFITTVPTLQTMTKAALNCLHNRGTGFFLMIEGGAVDWANHSNQAGRMIEELSDFTNSIRVVCEWVEKNSSWDETLVIVTADHETGLLWGPESDRMAFQPVVNNGAGQMPGLHYNTGDHSNSLVPLFVRGPGAKLFEKHIIAYDPKYGAYVDNIDIFKVMRAQLPPAGRKTKAAVAK